MHPLKKTGLIAAFGFATVGGLLSGLSLKATFDLAKLQRLDTLLAVTENDNASAAAKRMILQQVAKELGAPPPSENNSNDRALMADANALNTILDHRKSDDLANQSAVVIASVSLAAALALYGVGTLIPNGPAVAPS